MGDKRDETLVHSLIGSVSGALGIVVGHPLDTLKVVAQTERSGGASLAAQVAGAVRSKGIRGLYRGVVPPVIGDAVMNAGLFGVFHSFTKQLQPEARGRVRAVDMLNVVLAGGLAGIVVAPWVNTYELLKVRLQVNPNLTMWRGIRELARERGLSAMTMGLGTCVMRDSLSYAAFFGVFEWLQRRAAARSVAQGGPDAAPSWAVFVAGGIAGQACWLVSYPLDVIKTRQQAAAVGERLGAWRCAVDAVRAEGPGVLFRGVTLTLVRAFPVNAAILGSYELMLSVFNLWSQV